MDKEQLMRRAIALSEDSVRSGGGPFGAVIASKDGEIIAEASNSVTIDHDPTAHAEVNCIRKAAAKLGSFNLSGKGLTHFLQAPPPSVHLRKPFD